MSTLFVEPVEIQRVVDHPNADRLEIAWVKGWQNVVGKGTYKAGDVVVHVPPDAMVPRDLAESWGVAQYLSFKKDEDRGKVRAARLRGQMSYGFLVDNDTGAEPGTNLAEHYSITKWEPPPSVGEGDCDKHHPGFHKYSEVENLQNFPDLFEPGEKVVASEKLHGRNCRVGVVKCVDEDTNERPVLTLGQDHKYMVMAGSHGLPRKCGRDSVYEWAWREQQEGVTKLLGNLVKSFEGGNNIAPLSVIVFGEMYGYKMQDLTYDMGKNLGFAIFDIAVDHQWLDHDEVSARVEMTGLEMVPILYKGEYDIEKLTEVATGSTTLGDSSHIREGLVVRPIRERRDRGHGRVILKLKNPDYVMREGGSEYK